MTEISNDYAVALFSLALENGQKKEYGTALEHISAMLCENPEYLDFLASPHIPATERCEAVEKAFGDSLPEQVMSFLQLLCEKGKISIFEDCVASYKKLLDESEKIALAKITSATELTDAEKDELVQKLEKKTGRKVTLDCCVDSAIMGGIIVEIDGKIIDGSVRARLADVKDVIST